MLLQRTSFGGIGNLSRLSDQILAQIRFLHAVSSNQSYRNVPRPNFRQTDYEEGYVYGEDADNEVSKLSAAGAKFGVDKEKSNAILLGLLGSDHREASPPDDTGSLQNGVGMGKKKRDSEVIDW